MSDDRQRQKLNLKYPGGAGEVLHRYPTARVGGSAAGWHVDFSGVSEADDVALALALEVENLVELVLSGTKVTKRGLLRLEGHPTLGRLVIENCGLSPVTIQGFRYLLPKTQINEWPAIREEPVPPRAPPRPRRPPFEAPDYERVRYFIVGARPVMLINHEGRIWSEAIDWKTGEFNEDESYLRRVWEATNVEVDAVDFEHFRGRVDVIRGVIPSGRNP